MHITLQVPCEDSMAAIWVVFGHSAVISKKEKWSADIRTSGSGIDNSLEIQNTTAIHYKTRYSR